VGLWHTRFGALVAAIALVAAPAARAACAVRCATASVSAPAARQGSIAVGQPHAHHHGSRAHATPEPGPAIRDTRCGPAGGGCLVLRDTPATPASRLLHDAVSLAHATSVEPVVPLASTWPAHRPPPIRPPGPTAAFLPLRI